MELPKITDGELKILNVLWDKGALTALEVVKELAADCGWNKNTTYTFLKRLVDKGVIRRGEPGFVCTPLYTREQIGAVETRTLIDKMFGGSFKMMVASFLSGDATEDEIAEARAALERLGDAERVSGNGGEDN